jgi:HD-like signal output (HDOD) protein
MTNDNVELSPQVKQVTVHLEKLITDQKIEVPMLPDVANRVLALSNDPDSDAAQLAKLIQSDQALAGHVMTIANSAAYTPNASMVSLQQAVARLGMGLITEIALAASLNTKLFKAPTYQKRIEQIWSHALSTALWGKEVARISKKNVEASFLCGLLHSIGRPVILQSIYEYATQHDVSISQEEALVLEQLFNVSFGNVIVQKWKMPSIVQDAVQFSQNYSEAPTHSDQAMVVNAAAKLATVQVGTNPDSEQADLDDILKDGVFSDLNLYEDEIEILKQQADNVKAGMEAMRL